jgi:hypothetical protein
MTALSSSDPEPLAKTSGVDPGFCVFLLIGQSNMEGVPLPEPQDLLPHPRVEVLAYDNVVGREYNQWHVATPPLHSGGTGVGPGDYFAKTLIEQLPDKCRVGLVPCGIKGVDIDFFRKGVVSKRRPEFPIPPDNHWAGAYEWVISRAKLAQEVGVIRGILFHQGESDSEQTIWMERVAELVRELRRELGLGETVPFLVGELCHSGACASHNEHICQLPQRIANTFVVSAEGLTGIDRFHFDLPSQRELGRRYGRVMLEALGLSTQALLRCHHERAIDAGRLRAASRRIT